MVTVNASQYTLIQFYISGNISLITQYNFTLVPWYIGCHALTNDKSIYLKQD